MEDTQVTLRDVRACDVGSSDDARVDIFVSAGVIQAVLPTGAREPRGDVIEGDGALVLPGLINAHAHSHEYFMRGQVSGLPLEPYILRISPRLAKAELPSPSDVYDRTLATCADMLLGGITSVADDVEHSAFTDEYVDAVLQAYQDSGLRARVSILMEDLGWLRSIPFISELMAPEMAVVASGSTAFGVDEQARLSLYRRELERWQSSRLVGLMVAPSAPQRSSVGFLRRLWSLAEEYDVPFHIHVQESLTQAVSGPLFFGKSMVQYLDEIGCLGRRTMVAHGVWLDDADVATLGERDATVVHNPVSNLKLGSGVARTRCLLDHGVHVALGCDGYTCNDSQDMFEAMKFASLLSNIASVDPDEWVGPHEAFRMATCVPALGLMESPGLQAGGRADLVVLDPFAPALLTVGKDIVGQVVFCAKRGDVRDVIVDGRLVVRNRKSLTVDVASLRGRLIGAAERFWKSASRSLDENEKLMPYFTEAYRRSEGMLANTGLFRLVPDQVRWRAERVRHNVPEADACER